MVKYLFESQSTRFYFINQDDLDEMYTFNSEGQKMTYQVTGIIGEAVGRRQLIVVKDSPNYPRYNGRF